MTGTTLSHYRLLERLGEGATAVVYKAEDLALGRPVALKLLPQTLSVDLGKIARFQHEARTSSTLNHPNICTIYEIDQHENRHFIAMEYLEGRPLSRVIEGRPLEGYRLIELAIQIADGLEAAHDARVIHRDLKPANIYVTQRDHVKLLDFGLATLMPSSSSLHSLSSAAWLAEPGGTGPYMSPEQTLGEPLDTRSDLFSFGVVLYEMATGSRPFTGNTHAALLDAIRHERAFPPRDLNTAVRDELDRIINKALEKNRKLRYQTASDLSADLRRLKRDLDAGVHAPVRPQAVTTDAVAMAVTGPPPRSRSLSRKGRMGTPWVIAQLAGTAIIGGIFVSLGLPARGADHARPARPQTLAQRLEPPDIPAAPPVAAVPATPAEPVVQQAVAAPAAPTPAAVPPRTVSGAANTSSAAPGAVPPPASPAKSAGDLTRALRIAEAKADLHLYDQALDTLRDAIRANGFSVGAPAAYLLMASIHERRGQMEDAIATYLDTAAHYPNDARAPQALFNMAGAILKSKHRARDVEAAKIYTDVARSYPRSAWAPRALMARAGIEQRRHQLLQDTVLGRPVPAAVVTFREVVEGHIDSPEREHALWRLSGLYLDLKRYDLAADMLRELGTRYSSHTYEAWFTVAELYEKRLNNPAAARAAYAQVPPTSAHWNAARKRLGTRE